MTSTRINPILTKILTLTGNVLHMALYPIRRNALFFVFMFILGVVCSNIEMPDTATAAATELFTDLYILCAILCAIPRCVRRPVRGLLSAIAYAVAAVDMWCFVRLGATLNPSMLMLLGETNGSEASEFVSTYVTWDTIASPVGIVLLIMTAHIGAGCYLMTRKRKSGTNKENTEKANPSSLYASLCHKLKSASALTILSVVVISLFAYSLTECLDNKKAIHRLMSYDTIGAVEHELTQPNRAVLYQPAYRLAFSIYANKLTARQLVKLIDTTHHIQIDSCTFRSPDIVFIIGESYNRHHSQLYGYDMATTPRQAVREKRGELVKFTDAVSPWNLTSYVFKHLFSLYAVGDSGEWCDYPLFPELFKKAGYHVTFITNQFLPKAKEAVYDFSGGFFLNNPQLSDAQFSTRNTALHRYDDGVLADYDRLSDERGQANLTILHLMGQHVTYRDRLPKNRRAFEPADYTHRRLSGRGRCILADYDNATHYNDSIVDEILRRFEDREAIVIYMSDHGEEAFGDDKPIFGRMHSDLIDYRMAHEEFEIPLWIWHSKKYAAAHPDIMKQVRRAANRPFMTDAMAHLLIYLGGIYSPHYRDSLNPLSDNYDTQRPRLLKHTTDYDILRQKYRDGQNQ